MDHGPSTMVYRPWSIDLPTSRPPDLPTSRPSALPPLPSRPAVGPPPLRHRLRHEQRGLQRHRAHRTLGVVTHLAQQRELQLLQLAVAEGVTLDPARRGLQHLTRAVIVA